MTDFTARQIYDARWFRAAGHTGTVCAHLPGNPVAIVVDPFVDWIRSDDEADTLADRVIAEHNAALDAIAIPAPSRAAREIAGPTISREIAGG